MVEDILLRAVIDGDHAPALSLLRASGNPAFTPAMRLAVYAEGYRQRLLQTVRADYPLTRALMNEDAFDAAAAAYIAQTPSRDSDLNFYAIGFAAFLALNDASDLVADTAAIESAVAEVYYAPECPALNPELLLGLDEAAFAALRVQVRPSVRLVSARNGSGTAVVRRRNAVCKITLSAPELRALQCLAAGAPLGEALDDDRLDVAACLQRWLCEAFFAG